MEHVHHDKEVIQVIEYLTVHVDTIYIAPGNERLDVEYLQRMSDQGWEFVGVFGQDALFKRSK